MSLVGTSFAQVPTSQAEEPVPVIVGLGDSYTSGVGASEVDPDSGVCRRAVNSYPLEAARLLDGRGINAACSGASVDALSESFSGQLPQAGKVDGAKYAVMTVGGNDALSLEGGAQALAEGGVALANSVETVGQELTANLEVLKAESPDTKIMVMGYPNPLPTVASATCPAELTESLSPEQLDVLLAAFTEAFTALNGEIREATEASGGTYISTKAAFEDRDLCAEDSYFNGLEDLTIAAHPNDAGHGAMAALTVETVELLRANKSSAAAGEVEEAPGEQEVLGSGETGKTAEHEGEEHEGESEKAVEEEDESRVGSAEDEEELGDDEANEITETDGEEELAFTGNETPIGLGIGSGLMGLGLGLIWLRLRREEYANLYTW